MISTHVSSNMGKCFTPSSDESRVPVRERSSTKDTPPSSVHMADNRPGTLVQRKLRAKANKGPGAGVLAQFKSIITAYNSQTLQRKERPEEEELLQGKFSVFQRHELEEEEELLQAKFKAVQRQELEEEELLQTKFMPTQLKCCGDKNKTITEQEQQTLQRMEIPEEEELLQAKFKARQRKSLEEEALQMKAVPLQKGENNTGLPDTLKSGIEKLSGYAMDDVRVHYNSSQPAQLNAHAYAQGTDIHLAPGQEKHLSHEAWHVVQQKQGRVKPTFQMKGDVHINDDVRLEREADVMGVRALQLHFSLNDTFESPIQKKHSMCVSRSLNQTSQLVSVVVGGATYQVLGTIPGTTFQVVRPNWKLFGARRILDTVSNTLLPLTRLNVIEGIQIRNIFNALNVQGVVGLDSMVRSLENATGLLIPPRVTLARIRLIQNKLTNLVMIRILADHPAIVAMYPPGTLSPIFATAFQSLEIPGSDPHKDGQVVVYINYLTIGGAPLRVVYKPGDLGVDRLLYGEQPASVAQTLGGIASYEITALVDVAAPDARTQHYAYMEFVNPAAPGNAADVTSTYNSVGRNLAIAYVFGLRDIHHENFILLSDRVQFIDMEAATGTFTSFNAMELLTFPNALAEKIADGLIGIDNNALTGWMPPQAALLAAATAGFTAQLNLMSPAGGHNAAMGAAVTAMSNMSARFVPFDTASLQLLAGLYLGKLAHPTPTTRNAFNNSTQALATTTAVAAFPGGVPPPALITGLRTLLRAPATLTALNRGDVPFWTRIGNTVFGEDGGAAIVANLPHPRLSPVAVIANDANSRRGGGGAAITPAASIALFNAQVHPILGNPHNRVINRHRIKRMIAGHGPPNY